MKNFFNWLFLASLLNLLTANTDAQVQSAPHLHDHPRLLFQKEDETKLLNYLSGTNYVSELHRVIIEEADEMITQDPVVYEKTGKRLLPVSRTCLKRVIYLSYSYRFTKEIKYLKRAEKEMLTVAAFTDWNPEHFLDVAEMTTALAIGYDWLYSDLSDNTRTAIEHAIVHNGLLPSKNSDYNNWLVNTNNWNQVCNGGLSLGAMAIYESEPLLAQEIIDRGLNSLKIPLQEYEPDGAYPEGSTYWAYGTMFHILFLDACRSTITWENVVEPGSGFMKSANFFLHVFGPTGSFNYSDCRTDMEFTPAVFWYAGELNDKTILFHQDKLLQELMRTKTFRAGKTSHVRFLPLIPVWASRFQNLDSLTPRVNSWTGRGENPVSFHRSSWEDHGIYIGIKGGSPSLSHAHMDIGSFVMDAEGVRWAMDLGKHDYNTLESAGMDIWNRSQDSERWKVFRHNNFSHNTLTLNGELQNVDAHASIVKNNLNDPLRNTVLDISTAYKGQLESAQRGIAIADKAYVIVRDEIVNINEAGKVRWAMLTHDSIRIIDDHLAIIRKDGKKLKFVIVEPESAKICTYSANPDLEIEEENPGLVLIGFELELGANDMQTLEVHLIPGKSDQANNTRSKNLSDW